MKHIQIYEKWFTNMFNKPKSVNDDKETSYQNPKGYEKTIREYAPSKIDPSEEVTISSTDKDEFEDIARYSGRYTKETLRKSSYSNGRSMICPLCKRTLVTIHHGETRTCVECGMEMTVWGNALQCEIDNEQLEFYRDIKKYNL